MKALPTLLIFSAILATFTGCGKKNESGRNATNNTFSTGLCSTYSPNGQCSAFIPGINSSMNGINVNQVIQENHCILNTGFAPQPGANMQRQVMQTRVQVSTGNGMPTIVTSGDIYVGVTSMGDVAAVVGDGTANPLFVGYLCPRPISGQGMLLPQILVGDSTVCAFKYITAANIRFPDGTQANFRALSPGGSSSRQKFSFCQQ